MIKGTVINRAAWEQQDLFRLSFTIIPLLLFLIIYDRISHKCQCLWRLIDIVLNSPFSAFLKQLTVTLRRGVFVRLMNQRCIQQPNRCCSPPVSREMPTVSCTGHLAPWCLSLFILRGFPITRAGRGHFLSTLSRESYVHNTWRCRDACKTESGPCSAWSCLDSWTELGEKNERLSKSPWRESGHQVLGCWSICLRKGYGDYVDVQTFQSGGFILLLCMASEKDKEGC